MVLIERLFIVLAFVVFGNATTMLFSSILVNKQKDERLENKQIWSWKDSIWLVLSLISILILIVAGLFFKDTLIRYVPWLFIVFGASYVLRQVVNMLSSIGTIKELMANDSDRKLTTKELTAILLFGICISHLHMMKVTERIYEIASLCSNSIIGDLIIIAFTGFVLSVEFFLICSLSISPIQFILGGILNRITKLSKKREKNKKTVDFFCGYKKNQTLLGKLISCFCLSKWYLKSSIILLIPVSIILDILWIALGLLIDLLLSIIWSVWEIALFLSLFAGKTVGWILSLSERNIIKLSLRVSVIFGWSSTVIMNIYTPFLINQNESSKALEFISSAIIIPFIIEWILSLKLKKRNQQ